ncbi:MAG: carbohydrate ABC transporter permease [Anaerolineaceae bacterium]|nr:carbohydrate ABC transporter permease [Anaerolineaceae bacterium]MDE0328872.1 carbohydrate ABC transporter permease [Anaerolineaceae bacterium]
MQLSFRATQRLYRALTAAVLVFAGIFALFPLVWTGLTSLKQNSDVITAEMQYLPHNPTLENYFELWSRKSFVTLFGNSVVITVLTVSLCLLVGTSAAYAFSRYRFTGRNAALVGFLLIRMFPMVLMLIPLFIIMRNLGLLNTRIGLALAYTTFLLPIATWMLKGFFDAIPPDLEDAARIDGATRAGAIVRVVLPLAAPGVAATAVLTAIAAWNEFLFALMFTTNEASQTWPVGLHLLVGEEFNLPWGLLSAGGIISILPIIVFFVLAQKSLVRGLMQGAVKG